MNSPFRNQLLLQTVVEVDIKLSSLTQRLSRNRFLEIGDDPHLVQEIENQLLQIHRQVKILNEFFDLSVIPLSTANKYFALSKRVNEAIQYIETIREKDYGSQQHTREFITKLRECANSVNALSEIVHVNSNIIQ